MPRPDPGACISCGALSLSRTCSECGGIVLFEERGDDWSPFVPGGLRFNRCTIYGLTDSPVAKCAVIFGEDQIWVLDRRDEIWATWERETVRAIAVDDFAGMKSRLTATRFIVIGVLAFLVPKHTTVAYVTVDSTSGGALIEIPDATPPTLRSQLLNWIPQASNEAGEQEQLPAANAASETSATVATVKERLGVLDSLLADGSISADEHASRRATILDSI